MAKKSAADLSGPALACPDVRDRALVGAVHDGDVFLFHACGQQSSNLPYLLLGQLRPMMNVAVRMAAFPLLVLVVVIARAQAQVRRIYARWIVATVHDDHPFRDRSVDALVGVSMRADGNLSGEQENSISVSVFPAAPNPTPVRLFIATLEYVFGTEDREVGKTFSLRHLIVVPPAKLPADGWTVAQNALNSAA